jgi:ABC-type antimicrobial peptide transport system permease subunit
MDDYAYADRVINAINKDGYEAVSVYRVSAGEYDNDLVVKKVTALLVSAGSILIIFILSVLVIYAMMKLKRKDFIILKSLGMKQRTINQMNYYELITAGLFAAVILIGVSIAAKEVNINVISDMVKYYSIANYAFIVILAVGMAIVTGFFFNGHLKKFLGGRK